MSSSEIQKIIDGCNEDIADLDRFKLEIDSLNQLLSNCSNQINIAGESLKNGGFVVDEKGVDAGQLFELSQMILLQITELNKVIPVINEKILFIRKELIYLNKQLNDALVRESESDNS